MKTEEKEIRVLQYLEGELPPEDEKSFLDDAASDAELGALLAEYQQQERALQSYFGAQNSATANLPRPDLRRLPIAMGTIRTVNVRKRRLFISMAAAASIAAAVGGAMFYTGHQTESSPIEIAAAEGRPQSITPTGTMTIIQKNAPLPKDITRFKTPEKSYLELALGKQGGSVELNSNSAVQVHRDAALMSVKLDRGEVVVWPASNSKTPMSVSTPQLQASTQNGAFSVVRGLRGSEVSVLKGEVEVTQAGARRRLREGESYSSTGSEPLPITERVAWSTKARVLAAALPAQQAESITIKPAQAAHADAAAPVEIAAATANPAPETGEPAVQVKPETAPAVRNMASRSTNAGVAVGIARTTDYLPASTLSLVEIPNFSALNLKAGTEGTNVRDLLKKTSTRDLLTSQMKATGAQQERINEVIDQIEKVVSPEELDLIKNSMGGAISLGITKNGPVLVAELTENADQVGQIFSEKINPWMAAQANPGNVGVPRGVVENGLLVVGISSDDLDESISAAAAYKPTAFATSDFLQSIRADVPQSRLTAAIDTASIRSLAVQTGRMTPEQTTRFLENTGLVNMKSIVAATSFSDQASNRAIRINFDGERQGIMNWLGEPAPLGSMQFFSPDAQFICAARIQKPEQMLNQIIQWVSKENPQDADPNSDAGVALVKRLAATLGNEAAIGLDNPVLPIPNIKAIIEVKDPVEFHNAMLAIVEETSKGRAPEEQAVLDSLTYKNRLIVSIRLPGKPFGVSYAIIGDYVVFGPDAPFLEKTVDLADSGQSIDHEAAFMDALPAKSGSYVSMLTYTAAGKGLGDAAPLIQKFLDAHNVQVDMAKYNDPAREVSPIVAYAVAEGNKIDFFVNGVKGDYQTAGMLPLVANWLSTGNNP